MKPVPRRPRGPLTKLELVDIHVMIMQSRPILLPPKKGNHGS